MSPASVEVLDSAVPDIIEHRASLLLRVYAEPINGGVGFVPKRPRQSREAWFLVDAKWFARLRSGNAHDSKPENWFKCADPGPLDNSVLVDSAKSHTLKARLVEGLDYIVVNEAFWRNIQNWYQVNGPELVRYVANDGNLEVYPPVFRVSFTRNATSDEWEPSTEIEMTFSGDTTLNELHSALEQRIGLTGLVIKHELYKDFTEIRKDGELGKRTLKQMNWPMNSRLLVILPTRTETLNLFSNESGSSSSVLRNNTSALVRTNMGDNQGSAARKDGIKKDGLTGLSNLGNTCYMNAVLQCLSHTSPLRALLLSGEAAKRVNIDSKFGQKGEVVKELTSLVREMWSGKHKSVAPYAFKEAVDRWTSLFRGYKQQDAHEFLAFLLDGIHEDTNFNDVEHKPSVVDKLFAGKFVSKLTCMECHAESTSTETFPMISLELPATSIVSSPVAATLRNTEESHVAAVGLDGSVRRVSIGTNRSMATVMASICETQQWKGVVLAKINDQLGDDFRQQIEILRSSLILPAKHSGWTQVAFELEEPLSTSLTIVHCVHRYRGALIGSPFVTAIRSETSRNELVRKIERRFGVMSGGNHMFTLKTTLPRKTSETAHDLVVDDSKCPSMLAYGVLIVDWTEFPSLAIENSVKTSAVSVMTNPSDAVEESKPVDQPIVADSLLSRIEAFCAPEKLEGDDLWLCPKCNEKRPAIKQISLGEKMPEVLVLHLKRFNSQGAKLSSPVTYSPVMHLNNADYQLFGVIRHHGSTISLGHYDSIVRSSIDNKWYQFNDSQVIPIPDVTVGKVTLPNVAWNDPSAYVFFYRKKATATASL